jgi:hypothetical protein
VSWLEISSILDWILGDRCQMFPICSPSCITRHGICGDTDGPPGAGCTLKHHSLDPYGGHGMVQQQLTRCHGWKCHQFWVGFEVTGAKCFPATVQNKAWHMWWHRCWATRSWLHIETSLIGSIWRTWNGSAATDKHGWKCHQFRVGFEVVTDAMQSKTQHGMAWHRWATRSWLHIETLLIGSIWRTWSGSAAADKVSWLEISSILGWIWGDRCQMFPLMLVSLPQTLLLLFILRLFSLTLYMMLFFANTTSTICIIKWRFRAASQEQYCPLHCVMLLL